MRKVLNSGRVAVLGGGILGLGLLAPPAASAHCDTLDGPVVMEARAALEKGEVAPVFKWIKPEHEGEIRAAFEKTLTVRRQSAEARDLADMYFFETLVRIHRLGEGAPYTGLKPAGTDPGPAVTAGDRALEQGSVDALVKMVTDAVAAGIRERFAVARERRQHAQESAEAGRAYVAAYVEFIHYVERLYTNAGTACGEHAAPPDQAATHDHHQCR